MCMDGQRVQPDTCIVTDAAHLLPSVRSHSRDRRGSTVRVRFVRACVRALLLVVPALAEGAAGETAEPAGGVVDEVTVTARRPDLDVSGGLAPEIAFDAPLIRSVGASSLEELLDELAPEVSSGRGGAQGRPAFLVNGRRIANFREIRGYPPEAVERLEVYPEEVALRHGFRADQKVVNVVLRTRFRALEIEAEAGAPRSGDGEVGEFELARLQIDEARRLNLELAVDGQRAVYEADREIVVETRAAPRSLQGTVSGVDGRELDTALTALAGVPVTSASLPVRAPGDALAIEALLATANDPIVTDQRRARTLAPQSDSVELVGSVARPLGESLTVSLTGTLEQAHRISELGLPGYTLDVAPTDPFSPFSEPVTVDRLVSASSPLERRVRDRLGALDITVTAGLGALKWSWLTELERSERETETDRDRDAMAAVPDSDPFGASPLLLPANRDEQTATTTRFATEWLLSGPIDAWNAGPARLSAALRYDYSELGASSLLDGVRRFDAADRGRAELRTSVDVPLLDASRVGRLSTNLNAELADLSDFGTLHSVGAGLTWRPTQALRMILSWASEEQAPTIAQLGDPIVSTPNRRVFDFVRGEAVTVDRLEGGNPALTAETRRTWRLGFRFEPFDAYDLVLNLGASESRVDDPIIGFPAPSPEIEAAFPERFERNAAGELVGLDGRVLNVAEAFERRLNWSLRYVKRLETQALRGARSERTDRPRGGGPRGFGRRGRDQGGRLSISVRHDWVLEDRLELAPGIAPIDYVGRSAGGRQTGGAEHRLSARATLSMRGTGGRLRVRWEDDTRSVPDASGVVGLRTSSLATVDVEVFHTFTRRGAWARRLPWLARARVSVGIDNLFGEKVRVRDVLGATPAGSSPDELDPLGRVAYAEFRRLIR